MANASMWLIDERILLDDHHLVSVGVDLGSGLTQQLLLRGAWHLLDVQHLGHAENLRLLSVLLMDLLIELGIETLAEFGQSLLRTLLTWSWLGRRFDSGSDSGVGIGEDVHVLVVLRRTCRLDIYVRVSWLRLLVRRFWPLQHSSGFVLNLIFCYLKLKASFYSGDLI